MNENTRKTGIAKIVESARPKVVAAYGIVFLMLWVVTIGLRWLVSYQVNLPDHPDHLGLTVLALLLFSLIPTFVALRLSSLPKPPHHKTILVTARLVLVLLSIVLVISVARQVFTMGNLTGLRDITEMAHGDFVESTHLLGLGLLIWATCVASIPLYRALLCAWIIISGFYWLIAVDHQFYMYQLGNVVALQGALIGVLMNWRIKGNKPSWLSQADLILVLLATIVFSAIYRQPSI